jgi:hypothetical protein
MAKSNNIDKVSGYELTRAWFDFAFENQDILCPSHTAMFLWFVELNNRMGWAEKFGSPASQTMSAIGLKSYNTYKKIFDDLVLFGFIKVVSESKNQWSSCVIALSNNNNALYKALDKALTKHSTKQSESTIQSTSSIIKPLNQETKKPLNRDIEQFQEIARTSFENVKCSFTSEFKKAWFDLIQQDNWKKKSQAAYDYNLKRLMKFDEAFSIALVEAAIGGEYKGVVFPNTLTDYKKYLKAKDGLTKTTTAGAIESRANLVAAASYVLSQRSA